MSKHDKKTALSWADIEAYEPSDAPTGIAVLTAIEKAKADREALAELNRQTRAMREKVGGHRDAIERAITLDREVVEWAHVTEPEQDSVQEVHEHHATDFTHNW